MWYIMVPVAQIVNIIKKGWGHILFRGQTLVKNKCETQMNENLFPTRITGFKAHLRLLHFYLLHL